MPYGKPAGVACIHLGTDMACALFGSPDRPDVCAGFAPEPGVCGANRDEGLRLIAALELASGESRKRSPNQL